ncbi:argininosuccinate synthase [Ruminococcaceae bacterium OttesenSCG-928-D13]|nr:argininosuccinate synthase [Ruminococcaceae bacterium OttesenSCG-928-D13]
MLTEKDKSKIKKVVLAYSGGLDTSIIIPWLKENYNCEVIAVCADVGQGKETEGLEEKALATGASKLYLVDIQKELVEDFIWPTLKAGAKYEGYLLGTSFARPVIAKALVDIAKKEGADAICHGATGKGNDQVRFELTIKALAPRMMVIAPWREWDIQSREDAIEYAKARNIPLQFSADKSYSRDCNLWHLSHEGLELEDPALEPNWTNMLGNFGTVTPEEAPDKDTYITLEFVDGVPVALDGEKLDGVAMIKKLNAIGAENGIGIYDVVENRLVGMKSHGVYETPGGTILYHAHEVLESICMDKEVMHYKQNAALRFAELVYNGQWYTPLRAALSTFFDKIQEKVTGTVKLKLYKGNLINAGVESPYTMYDQSTASFATGESYNHADAEGFINLFGLPIKVRAELEAARSGSAAGL